LFLFVNMHYILHVRFLPEMPVFCLSYRHHGCCCVVQCHWFVNFFFQCPVVLLAGEATHERYFSTTHGAYESGQAQARVIIDYLNSQRSSSMQKAM